MIKSGCDYQRISFLSEPSKNAGNTLCINEYFERVMTEKYPLRSATKMQEVVTKKGGIIMAEKNTNTTIAQNKKALHDYFVIESFEAGIELVGTEVKSLRQGKCNLKDAWCSIVDGEIFVNGMHISPYDHGNIFNRDPMRVRKLLMHKKEIMRLLGTTKQDGLTLIPLSVYFKKGRAKVQVGLCKGKKLYDKRDVAAKKEAQRTIERSMKERLR